MDNPLQEYRISPELFEVATEYVKTLDTHATAKALDIPHESVINILENKEVKRYIDAIFLEQGYMQRNKLNDVMTQIIDMKLEEMLETGMGSSKDIADLVALAHKMRMDYEKAHRESAPSKQVNIQNNFGGDNYSELMKKIIGGGEI